MDLIQPATEVHTSSHVLINPSLKLQFKLFQFPLHRDCCNSVSIHPLRPILATGSGQYHFIDPILTLEDGIKKESDSDITQNDNESDLSMNCDMKYSSYAENTLVFWWIGDIPDVT